MTFLSRFTASQILFSARVFFDHMLCHRRDPNRWADIYNGKRLTTGRTIYGSRREKEKSGALWTVQTERRKPQKFGFDHMFDHKQSRSTWEIWARKCQRRNAVEQKRLKKHGRTRKDAPISVGVVEAAGSSPVTQTKKSPTSTCLSDFFVALQHSKLYEVITKVITKTNCIHLFSYVLICNEGESLSDPHLFLKFWKCY